MEVAWLETAAPMRYEAIQFVGGSELVLSCESSAQMKAARDWIDSKMQPLKPVTFRDALFGIERSQPCRKVRMHVETRVGTLHNSFLGIYRPAFSSLQHTSDIVEFMGVDAAFGRSIAGICQARESASTALSLSTSGQKTLTYLTLTAAAPRSPHIRRHQLQHGRWHWCRSRFGKLVYLIHKTQSV
jgi:hypothetical protein